MTIKQLVIYILITTFSVPSTFARTDASMGVCQRGGIPSSANISDMEQLASGIQLSEIRNLASDMCNYLMIANSSDASNSGEVIEDYILSFNSWTRETEDYQQKVSEFWNQHSEHFICENHTHFYKKQHFFMRVIDMQMYTPILIEYLLKDETTYPIDVNVIQNINGTEETVLDYIDSILNDSTAHSRYEISEIREIREILVTFYNAKHASEINSDV